MADRDDTAEPDQAEGALDVLLPVEPVDWAGHVPRRRVTAGQAPGGEPAGGPPDEEEGYPPIGWVPSARSPLDADRGMPLARMALARARVRLAVPLDVVTFTAACPACGLDCEWVQERQDTKVRSTTNCPNPTCP